MAKKRGPDGVPIDIPSSTPEEEAGDAPTAPPQRRTSSFADRRSLFSGADKPTRPITAGKRARSGAAPPADPATRVAGGLVSAPDPAETETVDGMADPVVGWLVVIDGPGKGCAVRLGNGQNSIGRGEGSRARLDFGDNLISRNDHAMLTYDPRGNRFFIQQGSGVNLAYLDGQPVLAPTPLPNGSRIVLGATTLRFVALCGGEFTWRAETGA